jgi:hypothetical protein
MANARTRFDNISEFMQRQHEASASLLYKQPAVEVGGTPFLFYMMPGMAFRLRGRAREQALALPGARLWAPMGEAPQNSPWVLVPVSQFLRWDRLAIDALRYAQDHSPAGPVAVASQGPPAPPPAANRWVDNIKVLLERAAALRLQR